MEKNIETTLMGLGYHIGVIGDTYLPRSPRYVPRIQVRVNRLSVVGGLVGPWDLFFSLTLNGYFDPFPPNGSLRYFFIDSWPLA